MLNFGLVVQIFFPGRFKKGRIEDFLLYRSVHLQALTDLAGKLFLSLLRSRLLEFFEPAFNLPMIGFEKRNRICTAAIPFSGAGHGTGLRCLLTSFRHRHLPGWWYRVSKR